MGERILLPFDDTDNCDTAEDAEKAVEEAKAGNGFGLEFMWKRPEIWIRLSAVGNFSWFGK